MKYNLKKYKNYNLHTIQIDNFRNCHFTLSFRSEFDPKKYAAFTMLSDLITDQSVNYPTIKYVSRHMDESFILNFYGSNSKSGRAMQTYIMCDYIDPAYIDDKNYLDKTYKFIFEMISNPVINDNGFDEKNFNIVKKRFLAELKSLDGKNDFIAVNKALKLFSKKETINFKMKDMFSFISSLTRQDLYEYYKDLILNSSVDIFVSGNINKVEIEKMIKKYYPFNNCEYQNYEELTYAKNRFIPKVVKNKSSFKQSTIVAILNVNCLTMFEREFVMPYYLNILNNNGLTSKLYQELREKNSLCYSVSSTFSDTCNYLMIKSTLKVGKERKAIGLVKKCLSEMQNKVTDKEFAGAYFTFQSSLKGMLDSLAAVNRLYLNKYYGGFSSYEEKQKLFKTVTVNDVYKLAKKIRLNTIYVLKGDKDERDSI